MSKQIGWDVLVDTAQEGGGEPTEPGGGWTSQELLQGQEENNSVQGISAAVGWTTVTALTSHVSVFCRYTFGSALFVGWVAGGLALVGGIMMCLACRGLIPEESR